MTINLLRGGAVFCALFTVACLTTPASAQQALPPQPVYYIGEGQVDLWRGTFAYSNADITVGGSEAEGGLALRRHNGVRSVGSGLFGYGTAHSLDMSVYRQEFVEEGHAPSQKSYRLLRHARRDLGNLRRMYPSTQTSWSSVEGGTFTASGATLTRAFYLLNRRRHGVQFRRTQGCANIGFPSINCGRVTSVTGPSGVDDDLRI